MVNDPEEKRLQHGSFVIHATRGVIRDQRIRRRAMVMILTAAVVLIISGATFLRGALDPHQHPWWFVFFWLMCAWLTVTTMLLAMFDLLMMSSNARKVQRQLRKEVESESSNSSANG